MTTASPGAFPGGGGSRDSKTEDGEMGTRKTTSGHNVVTLDKGTWVYRGFKIIKNYRSPKTGQPLRSPDGVRIIDAPAFHGDFRERDERWNPSLTKAIEEIDYWYARVGDGIPLPEGSKIPGAVARAREVEAARLRQEEFDAKRAASAGPRGLARWPGNPTAPSDRLEAAKTLALVAFVKTLADSGVPEEEIAAEVPAATRSLACWAVEATYPDHLPHSVEILPGDAIHAGQQLAVSRSFAAEARS